MTAAPDHINLWHGYSLRDIDQLARIAAWQAVGGRLLDPTDRYHAAWSAITETLASTGTPPTARDLLTAATTAVNRAGQDRQHTWGMARTWHSTEGDIGGYRRYWELARRATPSPEDGVVDRTALRQIWPRLSLTHQRVLLALAIHDGDHHAAAAALGLQHVTFRSHLRGARAAYRVLWHEHETPSRMWGRSGEHGRRTAAQVLVNRRQQRARREAA